MLILILVRLNLGLNATMGAVNVYKDNDKTWNFVCDDTFDDDDAKVVCKTINEKFKDGKAIRSSAFGNMTTKIGVTNVNCMGTEADFSKCSYMSSSRCDSGQYASVYCSEKKINSSSGKGYLNFTL